MAYALLSLPRLSAGQRKMVDHTLSALLRTELYVVLCSCDYCLFG